MSMACRQPALLRKSKIVVKDDQQKFLRIVDANFNRAKEGLRVCEDVCRFWLDDQVLTRICKKARHRLTELMKPLGLKEIIAGREIEADVGKGSTKSESQRKKTADIFYANCQRVKESLRVLEEFAKLKNVKTAAEIKKLRYEIYSLEKKALIRNDR